MRDIEEEHALFDWIRFWRRAAEVQFDRGQNGLPMNSGPPHPDSISDAALFILCADAVVVGAERLLGRASPALRTFYEAIPELADARDLLTHFDAYVVNHGNLQKGISPSVGRFYTAYQRDEESLGLIVGGFTVHLASTIAAVRVLGDAADAYYFERRGEVSPEYHRAENE